MPRRKRMYFKDVTYHVVQRGNNRQACFFNSRDFQFYRDLLKKISRRYSVKIHAYVLMTNHVHLLLTPADSTGISDFMKVVGSRYARYINREYERTGSLWEGRHKSSPVDSETYLLKCYRYIELNPVTANMVATPADYPWSSYRVNGEGEPSDIVTPHEVYQRLAPTEKARSLCYRQLVGQSLTEKDIHQIRATAHYCQPLGSDQFCEQISQWAGLPVGQMRRGRPRRGEAAVNK